MKYRYKIGAILLSICMLLPMFGIISHAASGSVSVSSKSATVGNKVTITCTIQCSTGELGTADVVLTYDQSSLEYVGGDKGNAGYSLNGGSGSVVYAGVTPADLTSKFSFTMTFKILKAGSHKVSVSSASAYDIDETPFTPSKGSGTITGKAATTNNNSDNDVQQDNRDKNNKLSALQVYPGTLSPAFDAGTTSYTVTVPETTTEVTISATAQSSKATVTVSGGKDLKLGANEAKVVVVAENGSSIAYNITIMCGEAEQIQIGSTSNTINEAFTDEQIPTGFSRTEVTYNGRQYEALVHANGDLQLMSLQNEAGSDFYIYNVTVQEFYEFTQITIAEGKYIIPLPIDKDIEEFKDSEITTVNVQNKNFDMWKLDEEFSVAYVMNQDGEKTFYRYDSVDGVFQRFVDVKVEEKEPVTVEQTMFPNEYYMYAIIGLGAICFILLIAMIYFIASRKVRREARKRKALKRSEKQKAKEEKQRQKEEKKLAKQKKKEKF